MASISIETKKITELERAQASASSDNDLLILRLSNGEGVKAIPVSVMRTIIIGALSDLHTVDKDSMVDAVNEVLATVTEHGEWLDGLQELFDHFGIAGAGLANSIFVDQEVSGTILTEKASEILNGTFEGLWVGQHVKDGSQKYRFMDFDYWLNMGDTATTRHHIATVPDANMYNAQMNDSNITTGAYVGSQMFTQHLQSAIDTIIAKFGSAHVLEHRVFLQNATVNGYASGQDWYSRKVDLMSEEMVYGTKEFKNIVSGTNIPSNYTVDHSQLAGFRLRHDLICNREWYWLRDVVNAACFANVYGYGNCNYANASNSAGVRPAFPLI